jgi:hypothetical protein
VEAKGPAGEARDGECDSAAARAGELYPQQQRKVPDLGVLLLRRCAWSSCSASAPATKGLSFSLSEELLLRAMELGIGPYSLQIEAEPRLPPDPHRVVRAAEAAGGG